MAFTHRTFAAATLLAASLSFAATSEPGFSPRGKQLFSDDFNGAALDAGWIGKPGNWEVADGAAKASERPEDKHAAVRRHPLAYHDAVFEFSFRMDGARAFHLSLNNKSGHVCRLIITPAGMVLQADAHADLKPEKLATLQTKVASGQWHKVIVEVHGAKMTAQIDGKESLSGENPRVDVDKLDLGFAVSGVSASIDYVRIYEVAPR